ncbi:MAG TPA: CheR family methyltransferase [Candidatus Tectomicrobia bacterium]|jgi:chemotaxis protein methyltransferase CheR
MSDTEYVGFLRACLPRFGLRWQGFRQVRGQVIKRLKRRLRALHLQDLSAYTTYLEHHFEEWSIVESFCRISVSRFFRNREVFETLRTDVLPRLAQLVRTRHECVLRCWSAGCASGEEAYSLQMLWRLCLLSQFPDLRLDIVATDVDRHLLERARHGWYPQSSVRELPPEWLAAGFDRLDHGYVVRQAFRTGVWFIEQDIRQEMPPGRFHLVLCRNLVFTYFLPPVQREILAHLATHLVPVGMLVVGQHETLPPDGQPVVAYAAPHGIFQKPVDVL